MSSPRGGTSGSRKCRRSQVQLTTPTPRWLGARPKGNRLLATYETWLMKNLIITTVMTALLIGCSSMPQIASEKPPKHAKRVQVALFDSAARPPTTNLDIFDAANKVKRSHRLVATLTCDGPPSEEGVMINAIAYRARVLGAQAMIILPQGRFWTGRRIYRAEAVVYTDIER